MAKRAEPRAITVSDTTLMQPGAGTTVERQVAGEFGDRSPVLKPNQTKPKTAGRRERHAGWPPAQPYTAEGLAPGGGLGL